MGEGTRLVPNVMDWMKPCWSKRFRKDRFVYEYGTEVSYRRALAEFWRWFIRFTGRDTRACRMDLKGWADRDDDRYGVKRDIVQI